MGGKENYRGGVVGGRRITGGVVGGRENYRGR